MSRTTIMMTVSATAVMTVLLTGGAVYAADLADDEIFKRVIADWKRMSDPDKISQLEVKWGDWYDSLNDTAKRQAYVDTSIERDQIRAEMTAYETRHKYIEASIEVMLGEPANSYPKFSDVSYLDKLADKLGESTDKQSKKEIKQLKKKIEKKQDKINDLEEQIKEKDKKIKKLKKTISKQQDNIQDMKAQMGEGTDEEEETLPESEPITTNSTNIEAAATDVIAHGVALMYGGPDGTVGCESIDEPGAYYEACVEYGTGHDVHVNMLEGTPVHMFEWSERTNQTYWGSLIETYTSYTWSASDDPSGKYTLVQSGVPYSFFSVETMAENKCSSYPGYWGACSGQYIDVPSDVHILIPANNNGTVTISVHPLP